MTPLAAYVAANGPVFWLAVAAAMLALEAMSGRAWWIWVAFGAGVAALLSLWLDLSLLLEFAAFIAATILGVVYSLQMRIAAARRKAQARKA
jgi:membrane protein implicated in regulation of membrane protease activity